MSKVIVITGAGSGFGALSARQLADAGHTVYAGMRESTGRNADRVKDAADFAEQNGVDLRTRSSSTSARRNLRTPPSAISSRTRAAWTLSSTTPDPWSSARPRRSHLRNSRTCTTSTSSAPSG
jgi:NAD(P)-dependent dehydrogenase (short-subunit alcohol dehydrogenase family)